MIVDYHVHLEEGPYSLKWWNKTALSILSFSPIYDEKTDQGRRIHDLQWLKKAHEAMGTRLQKGAYDADWMDLYLQKAKEQGISEVGIVDHLYRFIEFKPYYERFIDVSGNPLGRKQRDWLDSICIERIDHFVSRIEEERERWKEAGVSLKLGIEADFFPGGEEVLADFRSKYPLDYIIGSIHFLEGWGFDNPDTQDFFKEKDLERLYDLYFSIMGKAIKSNLFEIIGHPDNLKVFGYKPDEQFLRPYYFQISNLLVSKGIATELNAGLSYRYPVQEFSPSDSFLQILAAHGAELTTSSDAHFPDDLGTGIKEARELLRRNGYSSVVGFEKGKKVFYSLDDETK